MLEEFIEDMNKLINYKKKYESAINDSGTAKTNNNVAFSNSTLSLNYIAFDWS